MTVRRHGWQYPAHVYQVIAITIFLALSISNFFLAPLAGNTIVKNAVITLYSLVAFAVFFLYVRCTAIDPADPGVLVCDCQTLGMKVISKEPSSCDQNASKSEPTSLKQHYDIEHAVPKMNQILYNHKQLCMLLWLAEDDICRKDHTSSQSIVGENALFCTLCNVEVKKFSKHCRSCNKCVEGFDHHCWWLNNCVGKKNYLTFVCLMATCLAMLLLDSAVGLLVLARCFVNKNDVEKHIANHFSGHISMASFSAIVTLFTLIPSLASVPLGELFLFHIVLMRKGLTTYEYVIAMRAQTKPQTISGTEQVSSISPADSTMKSWNGFSSCFLQQQDWCASRSKNTKEEEEVVITSNAGPATTIEKPSQSTVKINPWKLAKLNSKKATEAAVIARENSSVMRSLKLQSFPVAENNRDLNSELVGKEFELSDAPFQCASNNVEKEDIVSSPSPCASSEEIHHDVVDDAQAESTVKLMADENNSTSPRDGFPVCRATILPPNTEHRSWICTTPVHEGYKLYRDCETHNPQRSQQISGPMNQMNSKTTVYWDRAARQFKSLPDTNGCLQLSTLISTQPSDTRTAKPLETSGHDLAKNTGGPYRSSLGRNPIFSSEKLLVNGDAAPLEGPLKIPSSSRCLGKENSLKLVSDRSQGAFHQHLVLPSQRLSGGPTSVARTVQRSILLSHITSA